MMYLRIATVALLLVACAGPSAAPNLDGRDFLSTNVTDGGAARPLVPDTRISLRFADGQLSAQAGCNSIGGTYRVDAGRLVVGAVSMTEMGCDEPRATQDEWLIHFLSAGPTLRVEGDTLTLEGGTTVITLLDRQVAQPDVPLVGPTWLVTSVMAGDTVSSVPEGVVATFQFRDDGQLFVNTGCNEGSARYSVEANVLRVSEVTTTLKLCEGAAGQMEASVMELLQLEAMTWSIDSSSLTISDAGRGLQLTAR